MGLVAVVRSSLGRGALPGEPLLGAGRAGAARQGLGGCRGGEGGAARGLASIRLQGRGAGAKGPPLLLRGLLRLLSLLYLLLLLLPLLLLLLSLLLRLLRPLLLLRLLLHLLRPLLLFQALPRSRRRLLRCCICRQIRLRAEAALPL